MHALHKRIVEKKLNGINLMRSTFGLIVYSGKYTKTIVNAKLLTHFFCFWPTTKSYNAVRMARNAHQPSK